MCLDDICLSAFYQLLQHPFLVTSPNITSLKKKIIQMCMDVKQPPAVSPTSSGNTLKGN